MKQTHEGYIAERQSGEKVRNLNTRRRKKRREREQRLHCNESKEGNRISRGPKGKINKKRPRIGKYQN